MIVPFEVSIVAVYLPAGLIDMAGGAEYCLDIVSV
jgi:hypothetical protein